MITFRQTDRERERERRERELIRNNTGGLDGTACLGDALGGGGRGMEE